MIFDVCSLLPQMVFCRPDNIPAHNRIFLKHLSDPFLEVNAANYLTNGGHTTLILNDSQEGKT